MTDSEKPIDITSKKEKLQDDAVKTIHKQNQNDKTVAHVISTIFAVLLIVSLFIGVYVIKHAIQAENLQHIVESITK